MPNKKGLIAIIVANIFLLTVISQNSKFSNYRSTVLAQYPPPPTNTPGATIPPACTNLPPDTPILSSPANGAMVPTLSGNQVTWLGISNWGRNCSGMVKYYTVYMDTNPSPTTVLCYASYTATSCSVGTLSDSSLYYWKVVATNSAMSSTSETWNLYSPYAAFGWVYTEKDNSITRATEATEGLIPNYTVNLSQGKTGSYTTAGSAVGGYVGNYYFQELLNNTTYKIELNITPTGSVLYSGYSNPVYLSNLTQSQIVDFPFITVPPTNPPPTGPFYTPQPPTATSVPAPSDQPTPTSVFSPTPSITPGGPTLTPTTSPTPSITPGGPSLTPTPTITPGGPTLTPTPTILNCLSLPTPDIQSPQHELCTNIRPTFGAIVSDPNNDSVWSRFYSNSYETWNRMGSVQSAAGGNSQWSPDGSIMNFTGGYWWSAYTESPICPRSEDAQPRLLNMDYTSPPMPAKVNCSLIAQDMSSGNCTFSCGWVADNEYDNSCSNTSDYHPMYWNTPGPGNWDPGWLGNVTSQTVYNVPSEQNLNVQIEARDTIGNISSVSEISGSFSCPKVEPTPSDIPTPTSLLNPTIIQCQTIPTPILQAPEHQTCTNSKPVFEAIVSDPAKDNVWAKFYSNYHETFSKIGSVVAPTGGVSQWTPYSSTLNINGSYWWTAYAETPLCGRSADAQAALLNMDYSAPPQPMPPRCVLKSQDLVYTGTCTFTCSWEADPEHDGSCGDTSEYWPSYTNSPGPGGWGAHKINSPALSEEVYNVPDGQSLLTHLYAKDSAGNISDVSYQGGPYTCPKILNGPTITPGGPTLIPTASPTPSISPTPTITPTPSPGVWLQLVGGDIYQKSVKQDALPAGQTFLAPISSPNNPGSSGIVLWKDAVSINGSTSSISSNNWNVKLDQGLSNQYSFQYYWEALKNKAVNLPNKSVIGDPADLTNTDSIYYYGSYGYTQLSQSFTQPAAPKTSVTIFLISGSLEITKNFSIASDQTVIFIVSGNILVDGGVTNIPGLYISSGIFSVAAGAQPIIINGMVYAKNINLNRSYKSYTIPTYQFIYQPKYFIALLPYLGRQQVNWQEIKP